MSVCCIIIHHYHVLCFCIFLFPAQTMAHGPSCGWCQTTTSTALCLTTWIATPSRLRGWSNWRCQLPAAWHICTWRFWEHKVTATPFTTFSAACINLSFKVVPSSFPPLRLAQGLSCPLLIFSIYCKTLMHLNIVIKAEYDTVKQCRIRLITCYPQKMSEIDRNW